MKAHFGHITYDVEIVDELDCRPDEDREGPYGYSDHPTRQIKVVHQGEQSEEYAANTLLHELMHAAADVVGFHPENEEESVHALTAGLMLLLRDSRNAALVARLTGAVEVRSAEADRPPTLRDACPEPPWLPTEDGLAVYVDSGGYRSVYYVRDGKVCAFLRTDGTLPHPDDPDTFAGTWEPCP